MERVARQALGSTYRSHCSHCTARARRRFTEGSRRRLFRGGPDQHCTSRESPRETRQVFANLGRALAAAGASFADVIKLNYYVTDITMLPAVRAIRDGYIDTARPPASTAVQVVALAFPDFMIEIEAWAVCGDERDQELPKVISGTAVTGRWPA